LGGLQVVIVTHAYGNRKGVRYLSNGLKVFYLPALVVQSAASLPTHYGLFPVLRHIFVRERVDIVHGHQAPSALCHEAILHARTMGLRACFTEHSLYGFADVSAIVVNKVLKYTLSDIDHVICVSHTRYTHPATHPHAAAAAVAVAAAAAHAHFTHTCIHIHSCRYTHIHTHTSRAPSHHHHHKHTKHAHTQQQQQQQRTDTHTHTHILPQQGAGGCR
jgi:hypothetical protein